MKYIVLGLLSFLFCLSAQAQDIKSAEEFVRDIYRHEQAEDLDMYGNDAAALFSQSLVQLIKKDEETAQSDESGWLESDPVCDCQDNQGFSVKSISSQLGKNKTAHVLVVYAIGAAGPERKTHFDLVSENQQWRVDDIGNAHLPSLRQAIKDSIASPKHAE